MATMTLSNAADWLRERDHFLLITHRRPDGDTLCSAAGLAAGLRRLGKTVFLLENAEAAPNLKKYVSGYFAPEDFVPAHIVSVDIASEELYPENAAIYLGRVELAIDHHISNTGYAASSYITESSAACGEIVYTLLRELGVRIDPETASLLYIATATDTGCFSYANTTAMTLQIASELVTAGAPNGDLNKEFFRTKSKSRIALEVMVLESVDYYMDGSIAFVSVTREMLSRTGADETMLEDIAALPGQIEGVAAGITLREQPGGATKVSVRTNRTINANRICAEFSGGGHAMAAGCTIKAPIPEAKRMLLEAIERIRSEKK